MTSLDSWPVLILRLVFELWSLCPPPTTIPTRYGTPHRLRMQGSSNSADKIDVFDICRDKAQNTTSDGPYANKCSEHRHNSSQSQSQSHSSFSSQSENPRIPKSRPPSIQSNPMTRSARALVLESLTDRRREKVRGSNGGFGYGFVNGFV